MWQSKAIKFYPPTPEDGECYRYILSKDTETEEVLVNRYPTMTSFDSEDAALDFLRRRHPALSPMALSNWEDDRIMQDLMNLVETLLKGTINEQLP